MVKFVCGTTVLLGVYVSVQLPPGGTFAQVFPVSVTLPSKAVPVKFDAMFVAATCVDVLLIVSCPVGPFTVSVKGDPVTVITASVIGGACVMRKILALLGR